MNDNDDDTIDIEYINIKQKIVKVYWSKSDHTRDSLTYRSNRHKSETKSVLFDWQSRLLQREFKWPETPIMILMSSQSSFSLISDDHSDSPQNICTFCNELITEADDIAYEGNKIFTNEVCWKNWIESMLDAENFQIQNLWSDRSKTYFLDCVAQSFNGQLIIKVLLAFKDSMDELEFESLLHDNKIFYDHYMAFLRESQQTKEVLLRCKNKFEEYIRNLRRIMKNHIDVNVSTVNEFKKDLEEYLNEIHPNVNLNFIPLQMVKEYLDLLDFQSRHHQSLVNRPLIETLIKSKISYQAITDSSAVKYLKENFNVTSQEFFWTSLKSIVDNGDFLILKTALSHKGFQNKPDILCERIVAYLVTLNKTPDDFKMKCLLKISNKKDMIECANKYGFLEALMKYCKANGKNSQWKKILKLLNHEISN